MTEISQGLEGNVKEERRKLFCLIYATGKTGVMELYKEIGMIPFYAQKYGYESVIACYASSKIPKSWKGSRIRKFPKGPSLPVVRSISANAFLLLWFTLNAGSFDFLMILHCSRISWILAGAYRLLNRKGKLFFKTDLSMTFLDDILASKRSFSIFKGLVRKSDYAGIETTAMFERVSALFNQQESLRRKLRYIPNGLDLSQVALQGRIEKENWMLYVGHVGLHAKNTELLLSAFEAMQPSSWQLYLVGSIDRSMQERVDRICKALPGRVIVKGQIWNRDEIYSYYARAKIFCLTSRWESFCYALLEAAFFDDFLVTTDVGAARDLMASGAAGVLSAPTVADFSSALRDTIRALRDGSIKVDNSGVRRRFSWDQALKPVFAPEGL